MPSINTHKTFSWPFISLFAGLVMVLLALYNIPGPDIPNKEKECPIYYDHSSGRVMISEEEYSKFLNNQEIKQKWIKALRSGKYKQGTGSLRYSKGLKKKSSFCCLGVLCDLAVKSKVIPKPVYNRFYYYDKMTVYYYDKMTAALPIKVQIWANLDSHGFLPNGNTCLAELNDDGKTFEEIADIIEKHL